MYCAINSETVENPKKREVEEVRAAATKNT